MHIATIKKGDGWIKVWEGTKSVSVSSTNTSETFVTNLPSGITAVRVSGSYVRPSSPGGVYYTPNGVSTAMPATPFTDLEIPITSYGNFLIVNKYKAVGSSTGRFGYFGFNTSGTEIYKAQTGSDTNSYSGSITLTKIEVKVG